MIDGEGYLKHTKGTPILSFTSTDLDIAIRVQALTHASTIFPTPTREKRYKQAYRVDTAGRNAIGWMMTLYPILSQRRRSKIRDILEVWRKRPTRHKRGSIW